MSNPSCVPDASALLALLQNEPGAEVVKPLLQDALMSSVNWSEVAQKSLDRGVELDGMRGDLEALGLAFAPFTVEEAEATAWLRASTSALGLSPANRACLSPSRRRGAGAHHRPSLVRTKRGNGAGAGNPLNVPSD